MKENIYVHNLRLNLDRREELDLHCALMNFDKESYKSKNQFMIKTMCDRIFATADDMQNPIGVTNGSAFVTREEMEKRLEAVVDDVLKELSVWFIKSLASGKYVPIEPVKEHEESSHGFVDFGYEKDKKYY